MRPEYVQALETRLEWLDWAKRQGPGAWDKINGSAKVLPQYIDRLEHGETFVMDAPFCRLVDHARQTMPDTMAWDQSWMIRPDGWLWMAEPVQLPALVHKKELLPEHDDVGMMFRALGWRFIAPGQPLRRSGVEIESQVAATHFCCFQRFADYDFAQRSPGFGSWSYFLLEHGAVLGERLREFEEWTQRSDHFAEYEPRTAAPLHEMRWVYAAMYMMSQRLAVHVKHEPDRATRRRAEHRKQAAPPFLTVVTLRRLEAARPQGPSAPRDWQWQWEVRGHWRNQWYRKEQVHKPKFIEAYVKGPTDKPFKEVGTKLFVASR